MLANEAKKAIFCLLFLNSFVRFSSEMTIKLVIEIICYNVGEHISQDLVDKFREPETDDLYVIYVYEEGERRSIVVKKEKFDEAFEQVKNI
jgi:hypothetical protein